MNSDRIKEIQEGTAYPNSVSVQQALLQVWNECQQENNKYQSEQMYSEEEVIKLLDDYRIQLAYGERVFKTVEDWFNLNKKI